MAEPACIRCGLPEAEHHAFQAAKAPAGCVCEPREWRDPMAIPPICAAYVDKNGVALCGCGHEEACHVKPEARP